jgi:hypothetical protein
MAFYFADQGLPDMFVPCIDVHHLDQTVAGFDLAIPTFKFVVVPALDNGLDLHHFFLLMLLLLLMIGLYSL